MTRDKTRDKGPRNDRWYLNIMAPNTKGAKFAWLDPTSIYINGEAFHDSHKSGCYSASGQSGSLPITRLFVGASFDRRSCLQPVVVGPLP